MHSEIPSAPPVLTEKQQACLAHVPNRVISAGAGSGKTKVLVEKIGRLFGDGLPGRSPLTTENILALTFTRKAAGEMRTRVYQDLVKRSADLKASPEKNHLIRIVERFQASKITTIHGFASSLIRANPVILGIDPDFQLLEEAVGARSVRDAVNATLKHYWKTKQPALVELLRLWEPYEIRRTVENLLHKPIEFRELCETHGSTAALDVILAARTDKWNELLARAHGDSGWLTQLDKIGDHCRAVLQEKGNSQAQRKKKDKAQGLIEEFVEPLRRALRSPLPEEFDLEQLARLRLKVKEIGVFQWDAPTGVQLVDQIAEVAFPWLGNMDREQMALEWTGGLLELAQEAYGHLERIKRESARLSHDDLLILARDLCKQDPRKARIALRHFLVDEFQDTDPIQWEMIQTLSGVEGQGPSNLFLVGDVKQAIYGFRGADHTVFKSARDVLTLANPDQSPEIVLDDNFRSLGGPLHFTNEFFSRIFVHGEAELDPYSVPHQPLIPKRECGDPSSVVFLVSDPGDETSWAVEAVSVAEKLTGLFSGKDPDLGHLSGRVAKGKPLVGIVFRTYAPMTYYMSALMNAGLPYSVYQGRTFFDTPEVESMLGLLSWMADPADDVALASVLRSSLYAWTDEDLAAVMNPCAAFRKPLHETLGGLFHKYGVGFTVCPCLKIPPHPPLQKGGKEGSCCPPPFLKEGRGEDFDARGKCDPSRILAAVGGTNVRPNLGNGPLRAAQTKQQSEWPEPIHKESLEQYPRDGALRNESSPEGFSAELGSPGLPSGASPQRTWKQLQRLRRLSSHLSLSETLRAALDSPLSTILRNLGHRGIQASANIEKFLQLVRELEESLSSSPQVVLQALRDMQEEGPGTAEADTPESQSSPIQLMTIHAAKGLEFPVVVAACLGRGSRSGAIPFSKRIALADSVNPGSIQRMTLCGIDFPDPSAGDDATPTILKTLLKEHHRQQSESEEKRLLYVALTRACDHLILPLSMSDGKLEAARGSLARYMLDAAPEIGQAALSGEENVTFGEGKFRVDFAPKPQSRPTNTPDNLEDQLGQIAAHVFPQKGDHAVTAELPYVRRTRITVTELMTFRKCPRLFYFERYFRAPKAAMDLGDRDLREMDLDASSDGLGRAIGSMLHEILRLHEGTILGWKPGLPWPDKVLEALDRIVTVGVGGSASAREEVKATLLSHLGNLVRGGTLEPGGTVLREVPFEFECDDFLIVGAIDRLERLADNTWRLWDFKTTSMAGRTKEAIVVEESYDFQLFCYVMGANHILRERVSSSAVVFTADPDTPLFLVESDPEAVCSAVQGVLYEVSLATKAGMEGFLPTGRGCPACRYRQYELCRE